MDPAAFWKNFWGGFCKSKGDEDGKLWLIVNDQGTPVFLKAKSQLETCVAFKYRDLAIAFLSMLELGGVGEGLQVVSIESKDKLPRATASKRLEELLERAVKGPPMTAEEIREQRESWVRGEMELDRDGETRISK